MPKKIWLRRRTMLALAMASAAMVGTASGSTRVAVRTGDPTSEERNKQVVLDMWHDVIDGRNIERAPRYIAENYIQHSPSAGQGRAALMAFLKKEFNNAPPRTRGTYPFTQFVFVIAEGDLVQLMFQRRIPSRRDPAKKIGVWWYDTYRVMNGLIVEHWDSALE